MIETIQQQRLDAMRNFLIQENSDGFIIANGDAYFSEYPPEHEKLLEWLTGFTGSAGTAIILRNKAAFFTDGRYSLQAANELPSDLWVVHNISDLSPIAWLSQQGELSLAYDPWRTSISSFRIWQSKAPEISWQPLASNPVEALWQDRPTSSPAFAYDYPIKYAGKSRSQKMNEIAQLLKNDGCAAALLTQPESVNWLLNIRGNDIEFTPLFQCRAIIKHDATVAVYADLAKIPKALRSEFESNITLHESCQFLTDCKDWNSGKISFQPSITPVIIEQNIKINQVETHEAQDPCTLPKALKNKTELENIRQTHLIDGVALTKFLHWVSQQLPDTITELSAIAKLDEFRSYNADFKEPSFPTIAGFGAHGAVVHYRADSNSNLTFAPNSLFLVDSGGQYFGGTTDVTRTIAIGTPSTEMKQNFTRVLQGHIALAQAVFPEGTNGGQLDALARNALWQAGLNYDHGTGHGVGCYLGVHEGPQGISKRSNATALQTGMILSNEPGYYKDHAYGIRIENLVEVVPSVHKGYLSFNTLTCAPIDHHCIDIKMLTDSEKKWLNNYHHWVYISLKEQLNTIEDEWLSKMCQPL